MFSKLPTFLLLLLLLIFSSSLLRDDESEVVLFSLKTSELIGYFSPPEVWMPLVLSALRKTSGASNVVQVLASAIKGTKKEALRGAANGILESLLEPEVAW